MAIIADADLKTHLAISGTQHDTIVTNAVNGANQSVVQFLGRDPSEKVAAGSETARVYYPRSSHLAVVDDFHDTTNLVVETDEGDDGTFETTWASTDFQLEPLNQRENGITVPHYRIRAVESRLFPTWNRRASVQITAAWGWDSVPDAVFESTLLKAARLFHRKDSPQGAAGFTEFGAVRLTSNDGDIVDNLKPFRRNEQILMVG